MRKILILFTAVALAAASPAAAAGAKKKGGGQSFLQMPPSAVTVTRPDGGRGVLVVETGLDVKDPGLHARADALTPRLRDAYVAALQAQANGLAPGSPPHADRVAVALQRETDRVLGKSGARLLIGNIILN